MKPFSLKHLVRGNLRHRSRQYRALVVGILLAVTFVSVMILALASQEEGLDRIHRDRVGAQDLIVYNLDAAGLEALTRDDRVAQVGIAQMVGLKPPEQYESWTEVGFGVLDEGALDLLDLTVIEGRFPEQAGEVAVEVSAFGDLRQTSMLGDRIEVMLEVPGQELPEARNYTLVGIIEDRHRHIKSMDFAQEMRQQRTLTHTLPQVHVHPSEVDPSRSIVNAYVELHERFASSPAALQAYADQLPYTVDLTRERVPLNYQTPEESSLRAGSFLGLLGASLLLLASIVSIHNSMQGVLQLRRQQIGLLRAVGATRRQLGRIYLLETALLTLLAVLPGGLLGLLILYGLTAFIGAGVYLAVQPLYLLGIILVSIAIVGLASLRALRQAIRIPPMQLLTQRSASRILSKHTLKSKKRFRPSTLLSARQLRLNRGAAVGLSVFIVLLMLLVSASTLYTTQAQILQQSNVADISLFSDDGAYSDRIVYNYRAPGLTEADRREFTALPHITGVEASRSLTINLQLEEISNYLLQDGRGGFDLADKDSGAQGELRERFGIEDYLYSSRIIAIDAQRLMELEPLVVSGEIHPDRIAAGEEVLVYAPTSQWQEDQSPYTTHVYHNDLFQAGDPLDLSFIYTHGDMLDYGELPETLNHRELTVTIGAVLGAWDFADETSRLRTLLPGIEGGLVTDMEGLQALGLESPYTSLMGLLDGQPDRSMEHYIESRVRSIAYRYDHVRSSIFLAHTQSQRELTQTTILIGYMIAGTMALVCIIMVGGLMRSQIAGQRRSIGTIRAVGAPERVIQRSYRRQVTLQVLAAMLVGLFLSALLGFILARVTEISFHPLALWVPLGFGLVVLGAVLLSTHLKIRQVLRSTIVDTIRQP